jgi:ribosomal protein S18 acetylase RimI-like enzyme
VIFRVPSFVEPALDQRLEALGCQPPEGETITLYGHRDAVAAEADGEVDLRPAPEPGWLAAMASLQGYSETQNATYRQIVSRITVPAAFAGLRLNGEYVALAFSVVDGGIHICESVVTSSAHRRRGYGQRTLAALHRWAIDRGARHFCIQVDATNTRAVNLYRGLGLARELYRYHYRREPAR